jgi:dynein regulatory complex protein 1
MINHLCVGQHHQATNRTQESEASRVKYPEETGQFREENHNIILNLSKYTLRKIVMLICDEAGFLLEQKLVHLLQPLEKNEKSMVKLDSIFKALGVETETDVKLLAQYFINHRQYQELIKNRAFVHRDLSEAGGEDGGEGVEAGGEKVVPVEAVELIHPNEVLSALKTFVTLNQKSDGKKKLAKFSLSALNDRNDANDAEYWGLYENLIDEKKNKLWDAMLSSLQKYQ